MSAGVLICHPCRLAGRPAGERFKVLADSVGEALMEEHVREPHPAVVMAGVRQTSADTDVDVPLDEPVGDVA